MKNLKNTAQNFMEVFESNLSPAVLKNMDPIERSRMRCLTGLIALDAQIAAIWEWEFTPDWENISTLLYAVKAQPKHMKDTLLALKLENRRAVFFSSIHFILNTKDMDSFAPTLTDFGIILALRNPQDLNRILLAKNLIRMQQLRNHCVHTGKQFNPEMAMEIEKLLPICFLKIREIHPAFSEALNSISMDSQAA